MQNIDEVYYDFTKDTSELCEVRSRAGELERSIENKKIILKSIEGDGSHGVEISAHAFRQISDRLEALGNENEVILKDLVNPENLSASKLMPSNLRSFVFTLIASAKKKGSFSKEPSKNTNGGFEWRYNIEIKGWSNERNTLRFTCIVENNNVKTGYFTWD